MKGAIVLVIALLAVGFLSGCTQTYSGENASQNDSATISEASEIANSVGEQIINENETIDIGNII
jgi:Mn2+/Fe2+ NRAMP family transporter